MAGALCRTLHMDALAHDRRPPVELIAHSHPKQSVSSSTDGRERFATLARKVMPLVKACASTHLTYVGGCALPPTLSMAFITPNEHGMWQRHVLAVVLGCTKEHLFFPSLSTGRAAFDTLFPLTQTVLQEPPVRQPSQNCWKRLLKLGSSTPSSEEH